MNQYLKTIQDLLQQNNQLSEEDKQALLKTLTDADKQWSITEFKLDRTEKVKRTTAILLEETIEELEHKRKAVEEQNRELEIESSLEKVRTVAMGMRTRDDMQDICRTMSEQLESLGIKEIRNVQTAIFYKDKGTYINYEYYRLHDKALVTEVDYTNDEISVEFAAQMIKGADEVFIRSLEDRQVKDWLNFQKTTNVFIDTNLEKAKSLTYYWFSLGPVAIGTSTYDPLREEEITLFKRFRNVFDLAYRRYLDIEKAEAQAYEAKIEASLERVRAVAMSLRKSEDLIAVCEVMYKELTVLGFMNIRNAQIAIKHDEKQAYVVCEYSDYAVNILQEAPYNSSSIVQELYNELGKTGDALYQKEFSGKEFEDWRRWRKSIKDSIDIRINEAVSMCFYLFSMGTGHVGISTFNAISNEQVEILKRFKNVFELSYRRYTDVAKAEAQARESQIELALERVRARTMAMQKSEELAETSLVLFQQFKDLGETSEQISIGIFKEDENIMELYSTLYGSQWKEAAKVDLDEPVVMKKIHTAWKEQNKSLVIDIAGNDLRKYNAYRKKLSNLEYREDRWVIHIAFFSKGVLTFSTTEPHAPETIQLLERFAGVFDQTYTRFLDLQKAEAQAREAQIELGLERVRARAMAMQKSDELSELVDTVFKELTKLDFALTWCIINIIDESSMSNTVWAANPDINKAPESYHMLFEDYPFHDAMMKGWKERRTKYVYTLEGSEKKIYDDYLFSETEFRRTPEAAQSASRAMEKYVVSFSFSNFGGLQTVGDVPLSDANLDILSRFGKVFDLTYTRFNDLKQAEAQARESQIQLAMERVRARTMAMQKSDELPYAASLLFKQLEDLGIKSWSSGFNIWQDDGRSATINMCNPDGSITTPYYLPHTEDIFFIRICEARKRGEDLLVMETGGKELEDTYNYMFSLPEVRKVLGAMEDTGFQIPKFQVNHCAFFSQGYLMFITYEPVPEMWDVFKRLAKVFEQTYTRFLDLQTAEAQTRESQIQLAMERVRARTMAMQKSDELPDAAILLSNQVKELGVQLWGTSFQLWDEDRKEVTVWACIKDIMMPPFKVPTTEDPLYINIFEAGRKGEALYTEELGGEALENHTKYMMSIPVFKEGIESVFDQGSILPVSLIFHAAYFSNGFILFITHEPYPAAHDIFERFAKVFEQTYTRFLDLQKAETQAREAKIEAALEKVRSRSLAMHKSDELQEVVHTVFEKLKELNVDLYTAIIFIFAEGSKDIVWWLANKAGQQYARIIVPYANNHYLKDIFEAKETGNDFFSATYSFEEKNELFHHLFEHTDFKYVSGNQKKFLLESQLATMSVALAKNTGINITSYTKKTFSENENEILKRFAKVFEQAYVRFLDLQKAEAQARESQIEAALERVRSRSMAMQKSEELKEVIQVVYEQFVHLDIHVEHTGFIMDYKERDDMHIWLADKHTVPFQVTIPYFDCAHWNSFNEAKEKGLNFFANHLSFEEKNKFYQDLFKLIPGVPEETLEYYFSCPGLAISTVLLENVGLYIENFSGISYSDEENATLMRFGKVFQQTYTRFLDLQKAEAQAREAKIEAALEKVRSRSLAMHKSDELQDVVKSLFERLDELNVELNSAIIIIFSENSKDMVWWLINRMSEQFSRVFVKYQNLTYLRDLFKARQKELELFTKTYPADKKLELFNYLFEQTDFKNVPSERKQFILGSEYFTISTALAKSTGIQITSYSKNAFSEKENEILKRFAKVFDQSYTRFLDLQKAEAQAREAQIEAALERVRSKAMAMHKSEDLNPAVATVFEELDKLDLGMLRCGIGILNKEKRNGDVYTTTISDQGTTVQVSGDESMDIHPLLQGAFDAWLRRGDFSYALKGEDLVNYYKAVGATNIRLPQSQTEVKEQYYYVATFEAGGLFAFRETEFPEEGKTVMKRFANVFNLTYKRFLDLQKAEAQAREAKIEASLERVRASAMAMHNSNDISATTNIVFAELKKLDIQSKRCGVGLLSKNSRTAQVYAAAISSDGEFHTLRRSIDMTQHPSQVQQYESWLTQKNYISVLSGEELESYYQLPFFNSSASYVPPEHYNHKEYGYYIPFSEGFFYAWTENPYSDNEVNILNRFKSIIDLTFRRFFDLQKAEAQAREAQIESALERVRSRTMAMHRSEEIADIVGKIFGELRLLDLVLNRVLIWIFNDEEKYISWWSANPEVESNAESYRVDYNEHPVFLSCLQAWQKRLPLHLYTLSGDTKRTWEDHLFTNTELSKLPMPVRKGMREEGTIFTTSTTSDYGLMMVGSFEPLSDANTDIIQRFGRVFQQSYTRYLDVQKAEAQAREAKIEAAMEKVRARAMAMQKPGELVEVAQLLRKEMGMLGVEELETSSIYIHDEVSGTTECWYAIQDVREQNRKLVTDHMTIQLNDTWVGREMLKFYTSDQKQTSILMRGENRKEWINYCAQHSKVLQGYYGDVIPERTYHLLKFSNGYMGAASPGDISAESWELLKRATSVFSLAYTRFSDLQLAEANAKEAIKQSALDRIRADIASMRTTADLDKITPLIWNELTILGVPFIRCGVFIMDDSQKLIHSFLSTPEGKAIAAFHIPYDSPGNIKQVLSHWQNKKNYIDHWDEKAFTEFANTLVKQGALNSPQQYLKTIPKGGFHLHFLPFLQGMLYVGNTIQLNENEIKLIQSVADAFSTAYARYEDFNRLEAAKQQVEKTLVDLKQAQTQLVQSEKMASLGELTAGIAHEIQNPLNFVNNFSDVSNELLDEMKTELEKGNKEDAMAIADDVKQNLEKILHHGKRADAIVKGMLQHSRMSSGQKELTDINNLADEYLRLAYHGLRAKDKSFNAKFETDFDKRIGKINIIPQDIGRVLVNLISNAFYAAPLPPEGGFKETSYKHEPTVWVRTKKVGDKVLISVRDNGPGIPQKILDKIFQPFFTTKPTGQGTGLGLSLAYDIITKGHGGELKVETKEGEGTEFIISLMI